MLNSLQKKLLDNNGKPKKKFATTGFLNMKVKKMGEELTENMNKNITATMANGIQMLAKQQNELLLKSLEEFRKEFQKDRKGKNPTKGSSESQGINFDPRVNTTYKNLLREVNFGSRIQSVRTRLDKIDGPREYHILLDFIIAECNEDVDQNDLMVLKGTLEGSPKNPAKCCRYFQFVGSTESYTCQKDFIHCEMEPIRVMKSHKSKRGKNDSYFTPRSAKAPQMEPNYYIHSCSLCKSMRNILAAHSLWNCEFLMDLDSLLSDSNCVLLLHKEEQL